MYIVHLSALCTLRTQYMLYNDENSATGTFYPPKYFLAGHKIRPFSFHFKPLFSFLSFLLLWCPLYGFNFQHKECLTFFSLVVECICFYYTHKISFKILFVFACFYLISHHCTSTYCVANEAKVSRKIYSNIIESSETKKNKGNGIGLCEQRVKCFMIWITSSAVI